MISLDDSFKKARLSQAILVVLICAFMALCTWRLSQTMAGGIDEIKKEDARVFAEHGDLRKMIGDVKTPTSLSSQLDRLDASIHDLQKQDEQNRKLIQQLKVELELEIQYQNKRKSK